jgi:hypothetical protein
MLSFKSLFRRTLLTGFNFCAASLTSVFAQGGVATFPDRLSKLSDEYIEPYASNLIAFSTLALTWLKFRYLLDRSCSATLKLHTICLQVCMPKC